MTYQVLLDYDGFICKSFYAALGRDEDIDKAVEILQRLEDSAVERACKFFNTREVLVRKFVSKHSGKKDFYPDYKASRKKNELLGEFRDMILEGEDVEGQIGYEADDFIITIEEKDSDNTLTFSDDKDIKYYVQNYCKINLTEEPVKQNKSEIRKERYAQMLAGDKEDNITGVPKVGMRTGHKLLDGDYSLEKVIKVYKEKGISLDDTIKNLFLVTPLNIYETLEKQLEDYTTVITSEYMVC